MDVVVTLPKRFGLRTWINEGDAAGERWSGTLWAFSVPGGRPKIRPGERVYIVYNGRVRGYAPLVRLDWGKHGGDLVRGGGAVAVTVPFEVRGFRGWRYRWWPLEREHGFPRWREEDPR